MEVRAICKLYGYLIYSNPSDVCLNCTFSREDYGFCQKYQLKPKNTESPDKFKPLHNSKE